ncbi:MAG: ATP-binding protein [Candidatus Aenigmarchaeota archaeon]|nr:ATP-binding protein [Candidatus Aenigmarchaeota archaeon]
MGNISISEENITRSRARTKDNLNRGYSRLYDNIRRASTNGCASGVYNSFEDGFTAMDAVYTDLEPRAGAKKSGIISTYICADIGLFSMGNTESDGFFHGSKIDFSRTYKLFVDDLIELYTDALKMNNGRGLEDLTKEFFRWMKGEAVDSDGFYNASSFVKKNPIIIKDRSYHSLVGSGFDSNQLGWDDFSGYDDVAGYFKDLALTMQNKCRAESYMKGPLDKGILLYGPPGTGKTMVVRIFCDQAGVPFDYLDVGSVGSSFVNESAKNLQKKFDLAAKRVRAGAPASLLFIDEIDSLSGRRHNTRRSGEDDKLVDVLNVNMDGARAVYGVVVIGATNRIDAVDPALLRGGRFSVKFEMGYPDIVAREVMLRNKVAKAAEYTSADPFMGSVDYHQLADLSSGMSGADIEQLVHNTLRNNMLRGLKSGEFKPLETDDFEQELSSYRRMNGS